MHEQTLSDERILVLIVVSRISNSEIRITSCKAMTRETREEQRMEYMVYGI